MFDGYEESAQLTIYLLGPGMFLRMIYTSNSFCISENNEHFSI
jgi:hypothetical protein